MNGEHGQGDEFEHEFSEEDERTNLDSGLLAIVPRTYRVIAPDCAVYGAATGETFEMALPIGAERHLVEGGFVERADSEPAKPKTSKKES